MSKGNTVYSATIKGSPQNYQWAARFDLTDGSLGISQSNEKGEWKDRVLLSKTQVRELVSFLKRYEKGER